MAYQGYAGAGAPPSRDQIERNRQLQQALLMRIAGRTPQNMGEGIGLLGTALMARSARKRAEKGETARSAYEDRVLENLVGGTSPAPTEAVVPDRGLPPQLSGTVKTVASALSGAPVVDPASDPTFGTPSRLERKTPTLSILDDAGGKIPEYAARTRRNESDASGGYSAVGPVTRSGDRAYGAYQVMGENLPGWSEKYAGRRMTPQEFLADTDAQDRVFAGEFGGYLNKYGNPQDAASMWFSGKPMAEAGNVDDGYNTVPQYVDKFNAPMNGQRLAQNSGQMNDAGPPPLPAPYVPSADIQRAMMSDDPFTQNAGKVANAKAQAVHAAEVAKAERAWEIWERNNPDAYQRGTLAQGDARIGLDRERFAADKANENRRFGLDEANAAFDRFKWENPQMPKEVQLFQFARENPDFAPFLQGMKGKGVSLKVNPETGELEFSMGDVAGATGAVAGPPRDPETSAKKLSEVDAKILADEQSKVETADTLTGLADLITVGSKHAGYQGPGGAAVGAVADVIGYGNPGARAMLKKAGVDSFLTLVEKMKGALSDREGAVLMGASAGPNQTPEANKMFADLLRVSAKRVQARQTFMEQYASQNKSLSGAEAAWTSYINANPVWSAGDGGAITIHGVAPFTDYLTPPTAANPAGALPPQGAIDELKADPSPDAKREFDEIFGAGAAVRVLGK